MKFHKIHQIAVFARDLDETRTFYEDTLGAKFLAYYDNPPGLLFFDFQGTRILFEREGPKATLYFWVDDIFTAYKELVSKGISFHSKPHPIHRDDEGTFGSIGGEEWMAFFKDPSDNTLALATQQAPQ